MKMTDILKKYVLPNLPYLISFGSLPRLAKRVRLAPGVDASTKLLGLADGFTLAFQTSMPGAAVDWLVGLIGAALVRLVVYVKGKNAKKYRKDVEYGERPLECIILSVKDTYMDAQEVMHMTDYSKITALYSPLSRGRRGQGRR